MSIQFKSIALAVLAALLFLTPLKIYGEEVIIFEPQISLETTTEDSFETSIVLGESLIVRLPAQLSTGFSWIDQVVDPSVLTRLSVESEESAVSKLGVGRIEVQQFKYSSGAVGSTIVLFQYKRPWMAIDDLSINLSLTVNISE